MSSETNSLFAQVEPEPEKLASRAEWGLWADSEIGKREGGTEREEGKKGEEGKRSERRERRGKKRERREEKEEREISLNHSPSFIAVFVSKLFLTLSLLASLLQDAITWKHRQVSPSCATRRSARELRGVAVTSGDGRNLPRKRALRTREPGHGGARGAAGDGRERLREVGLGAAGGRELGGCGGCGGCGGPEPWEPCLCLPVRLAAPQALPATAASDPSQPSAFQTWARWHLAEHGGRVRTPNQEAKTSPWVFTKLCLGGWPPS